MTLHLICALAANRAIGNKGQLVYYLPADLRHFKALTTGHTVLMGRKTFESLPKGALPNRRNVVITRQEGYTQPGIEVFHTFEEALKACANDEHVYVIGGESVYAAALPLADALSLTHIEATPEEADTFFPETDGSLWETVSTEHHEPDERNTVPYNFTEYRRKRG